VGPTGSCARLADSAHSPPQDMNPAAEPLRRRHHHHHPSCSLFSNKPPAEFHYLFKRREGLRRALPSFFFRPREERSATRPRDKGAGAGAEGRIRNPVGRAVDAGRGGGGASRRRRGSGWDGAGGRRRRGGGGGGRG
jgi:hypothetical protein